MIDLFIISFVILYNQTWLHIIQIWDIRTKKLKQDLPGHADEVCIERESFILAKLDSIQLLAQFQLQFLQVFSVDWSPDGEKVASGGKDKVLKLWMG